MINEENLGFNTYFKIAVVLLGILALDRTLSLVQDAQTVLIPFIIAVFLTILLNPFMDFLERHRWPRMLSVLASLIITMVVVAIFMVVLDQSIEALLAGFTKYGKKINILVDDLAGWFGVTASELGEDSLLRNHPQVQKMIAGMNISSILVSIFVSFKDLVSDLVMVFLFLIFLLLSHNQLLMKLNTLFSENNSKKLKIIFHAVQEQMQKYLVIKTLLSLVTSLLVLIVLLIFDVDFPIVWTLLTFLLNFIPNVGSIIAALLPISIAALQFESIVTVAWLAVCLIGIQFVIGNIIEPRYMSEGVNLSPVLILFALITWAYLWGFVGMILAVPITVIIKIVFENLDSTLPMAKLMTVQKE